MDLPLPSLPGEGTAATFAAKKKTSNFHPRLGFEEDGRLLTVAHSVRQKPNLSATIKNVAGRFMRQSQSPSSAPLDSAGWTLSVPTEAISAEREHSIGTLLGGSGGGGVAVLNNIRWIRQLESAARVVRSGKWWFDTESVGEGTFDDAYATEPHNPATLHRRQLHAKPYVHTLQGTETMVPKPPSPITLPPEYPTSMSAMRESLPLPYSARESGGRITPIGFRVAAESQALVADEGESGRLSYTLPKPEIEGLLLPQEQQQPSQLTPEDGPEGFPPSHEPSHPCADQEECTQRSCSKPPKRTRPTSGDCSEAPTGCYWQASHAQTHKECAEEGS